MGPGKVVQHVICDKGQVVSHKASPKSTKCHVKSVSKCQAGKKFQACGPKTNSRLQLAQVGEKPGTVKHSSPDIRSKRLKLDIKF